ncbi:MAG: dihydrodipicolinate synthase family protein [Acidobacteriota bacterium]
MIVIPAHPLALTARRTLDERRQVALTRYYCEAGAAGIAVGVHTTQFAIRDSHVGLFEPVLRLAAEAIREFEQKTDKQILRIAGICGFRAQAVAEARFARGTGYELGLLSLAALPRASDDELLTHCRAVGEEIPICGFYLQQAVGGRPLSYDFWRRCCEIEELRAIKVAPFNRYQTLDVLRAVVDSGRVNEIALYTGNDDNIIPDLLTRFCFAGGSVRFQGGLLGQWAVWTRRAVEMANSIRSRDGSEVLAEGAALTDANAALFDAGNGFHGCIAGLHEILRRQGLLAGRWCLDANEDLSPGQMEEIDRVCKAYPHLTDDEFVKDNLDRWLRL